MEIYKILTLLGGLYMSINSITSIPKFVIYKTKNLKNLKELRNSHVWSLFNFCFMLIDKEWLFPSIQLTVWYLVCSINQFSWFLEPILPQLLEHNYSSQMSMSSRTSLRLTPL